VLVMGLEHPDIEIAFRHGEWLVAGHTRAGEELIHEFLDGEDWPCFCHKGGWNSLTEEEAALIFAAGPECCVTVHVEHGAPGARSLFRGGG